MIIIGANEARAVWSLSGTHNYCMFALSLFSFTNFSVSLWSSVLCKTIFWWRFYLSLIYQIWRYCIILFFSKLVKVLTFHAHTLGSNEQPLPLLMPMSDSNYVQSSGPNAHLSTMVIKKRTSLSIYSNYWILSLL